MVVLFGVGCVKCKNACRDRFGAFAQLSWSYVLYAKYMSKPRGEGRQVDSTVTKGTYIICNKMQCCYLLPYIPVIII
jgi:hypothetical protein